MSIVRDSQSLHQILLSREHSLEESSQGLGLTLGSPVKSDSEAQFKLLTNGASPLADSFSTRSTRNLVLSTRGLTSGECDEMKVEEPSKSAVRREVEQLENAEMHRYIAHFDKDSDSNICEVLQKKYPGQKIELKATAEGTTASWIVKVDGIAKHILKQVAVQETVFDDKWSDLSTRLHFADGSNLQEKVRHVFIDKPGQIFTHDYPHFNAAQREKFASIIGKNFGVPHTEVIKADSKSYSLHDFIKEADSVRQRDISKEEEKKIDLQSLQDIAILDILLENQDRNAGNVLVQEVTSTLSKLSCCCSSNPSSKLKLVPIDHALSYQKEDFQLSYKFKADIREPCWRGWKKADQRLTRATKRKINRLNAQALLKKAEDQGLVIDKKVGDSVKRNVKFLQDQVSKNPSITSNELYIAFTKLES